MSSERATWTTGFRCSPIRTAEPAPGSGLLLLEERPGVRQPEGAAQLWPVHRRLAPAAGQARAHDPGGGAALRDEDVLELAPQPDRVEGRADPPDRELPLPVLVPGAGVSLVGVIDPAQVGDRWLAEAERGELVVLGVTARCREEEGLRDLGSVEDDLQAGGAHGLVGLGRLGADASIRLAASVVIEVEGAAADPGREPV